MLPLFSKEWRRLTWIPSVRFWFLGDSITADGRYVKFLQRYFEEYARQEMVLMGGGLSSETLSGLSEATHPFPRPVLFSRLEGEIAAHPAQAVAFTTGSTTAFTIPLTRAGSRPTRPG